MEVVMTELTKGLGHFEQIIETGLTSFLDVGNALLEIQAGRLYLQSNHKTFEDYCRERWGLTRGRAYQLMGAAETVEALTIVGAEDIPTTESAVRELKHSSNDPVEQAAILKKAAKKAPKDKSGKPKLTAKGIKEAAAKPPTSIDPEAAMEAEILRTKADAAPKPSQFVPEEFDPAMTAEEDEKPGAVPKHLEAIVAALPEFKGAIADAGRLREKIRRIAEGPGGGKLSRYWSDIERMMEQVAVYLKCYRFWAPCPECKITDKHKTAAKDCKLCGGHGWIPKTNGLSDIHKEWLKERGVKC